MHNSVEKRKFAYVNLEKYVVSDQLGGKRHIEGVIEGFGDDFETTFISYDSELIDANCGCREVSPSFYYIRIAKLILKSSYDVINFRKTLIGMYICLLPILLMKIFGHKTIYILEYNGISGDFRVSNKIIRQVFLYLNSLPMLVYDRAYCVNENIANRLSATIFVKPSKVFVCPNGCFVSDKIKFNRKNRNQIDLVFYGSDQPKYHLEWLLDTLSISDYIQTIHLFGHGLERYSSFSKVKCHGAKRPSDFITELQILLIEGSNLFGVIPLDILPAGTDIVPIKAMDFLSVPIPILSSNACLSQKDFSEVRYCYNIGDRNSLLGVVEHLALNQEYTDPYWNQKLDEVMLKYSWSETLKSLVSSIE